MAEKNEKSDGTIKVESNKTNDNDENRDSRRDSAKRVAALKQAFFSDESQPEKEVSPSPTHAQQQLTKPVGIEYTH